MHYCFTSANSVKKGGLFPEEVTGPASSCCSVWMQWMFSVHWTFISQNSLSFRFCFSDVSQTPSWMALVQFTYQELTEVNASPAGRGADPRARWLGCEVRRSPVTCGNAPCPVHASQEMANVRPFQTCIGLYTCTFKRSRSSMNETFFWRVFFTYLH